MARELKDEMNGAEQSDPLQDSQPQQTLNPIQLNISPELQDELVQIVKEDYSSFEQARDQKDYGLSSKGEKLNFEKWFKGLKDLYNARREPKTIPWKFCSNRTLRIAASIVDMLHARLFAAIVNEDLLRWRPGETTDKPKVERISKLMYWWIWVNNRMRGFFDNWVQSAIGFGDVLSESSWKVIPIDTGKTIEEPIMDEMTGQPLINPDGTPAINRYREIKRKESSFSRIYLKDQYLLPKGAKDILREPVILIDEFPYRDLEQFELEGKFINVTSVLKEKLPVAKETRQGVSPEESERIRSLKLRNHPVKVLKWYSSFDADGDGFSEEVVVYVNPDYDVYLGGIAIKNMTKNGIRPVDFTKFSSRLDRPEELDGEGILEKIKELSDELDAIFNQMTDANTLSILRPGFYNSTGDLEAPILKIEPNRITPIGGDPTQNVMFADLSVDTNRLINAIRLVLEFIERLTAASSYVLGKESEIVGGSGTATRTAAIVQSAEQRFALPAERLREGAARIIKQHLDLLQLNIPPGLESRVLGENGDPIFEANELTAEGISGEYDAYLLPDPSMGSSQTEREIASMFYSILLQNVIVGTDPVKIYKVTADLIRSYGKDPTEYLGPEPDSDMIDSPEDENTLIVQGDFARVRAQITENHILHIKAHSDLLQSPSLAALTPNLIQEITVFTQQHIMEHQQMMTVMMALTQKFGGGGGTQIGSGNNEGGQASGSEGTSDSSRMENIPGPLGIAMDKKRKGESTGPTGE